MKTKMTEEQIKRLLELQEMGWKVFSGNGCLEDEYKDLCFDLVDALQSLPGFARWRVIKILIKGNDTDE